MALKLVWSNPYPLAKAVAEVRRIMKDEYGSLYLASYPDGNEEFELTAGTEQAKQIAVEQPEIAS